MKNSPRDYVGNVYSVLVRERGDRTHVFTLCRAQQQLHQVCTAELAVTRRNRGHSVAGVGLQQREEIFAPVPRCPAQGCACPDRPFMLRLGPVVVLWSLLQRFPKQGLGAATGH